MTIQNISFLKIRCDACGGKTSAKSSHCTKCGVTLDGNTDTPEKAAKRAVPPPPAPIPPIAIEPAEDRLIKSLAKADAEIAKAAHEERAMKRAQAERRLEDALVSFAAEKGLNYTRERPRVLAVGLSGEEGSPAVRKAYEEVHYPAEEPLKAPTVDIVGELCKSAVEPLQRQVDELRKRKQQRVLDYAQKHDLSVDKARIKLAVIDAQAHDAGDQTVGDVFDEQIATLEAEIAEKRATATHKVHELTLAPMHAAYAEAQERKRLELIASEHPIDKAFRALITKYQQDHKLPGYEAALVHALDHDPGIRQLFEARKHVSPTPEMLEASTKLAELEKRAR